MRARAALLLIAAVLALSPRAAADGLIDGRLYGDLERGFLLELPEGYWEWSPRGAVAGFRELSSGRRIAVSCESPNTPLAPLDYAKVACEQFPDGVSAIVADTLGVFGVRLDYQGTASGHPVAVEQYIAQSQKGIVVVTFSGPPASFARWQAERRAAAASVKLDDTEAVKSRLAQGVAPAASESTDPAVWVGAGVLADGSYQNPALGLDWKLDPAWTCEVARDGIRFLQGKSAKGSLVMLTAELLPAPMAPEEYGQFLVGRLGELFGVKPELTENGRWLEISFRLDDVDFLQVIAVSPRRSAVCVVTFSLRDAATAEEARGLLSGLALRDWD